MLPMLAGAGIQAAAGVLNTALQDVPTNVGGSGTYQAGPFVVGTRQVGGKGNSAGATTASAEQTPTAGQSGAAAFASQNQKWIVGGVLVALALVLAFFAFKRPASGRKNRR